MPKEAQVRQWSVIQIVELMATLAIAAAAVGLLWTRTKPTTGSSRPIVEDVSRSLLSVALPADSTMGAASSNIGMLEFADFQCPYCSKYVTSTLPEVERKFVRTGRVRYAFMHFPLQSHPKAVPYATTAVCAAAQGRFWDVHDLLFRSTESSPPEDSDIAKAVGLNGPTFDRCKESLDTSARVEHEAAEAKRLGVTGTPAFLVGRVDPSGTLKVKWRIRGAQPFNVFETAIEDLARPDKVAIHKER